MSARHSGAQLKVNVNTVSASQQSAPALNRFHAAHGVAISGPTTNVGNQVAPSFTRTGSAIMASSKFASGIAGAPAAAHLSPRSNLHVHLRGDLFITYGGFTLQNRTK
jgi:mediator of RNA polymerase II transcription subunit 14